MGLKIKQNNVRAFILFYGLTLLSGILSYLFTNKERVSKLSMPPFIISGWLLFMLVMIILTLSSIACYIVWSTDDVDRNAPLRMYILHLLAVVAWVIIFSQLQMRFLAFMFILCLILIAAIILSGFRRVSMLAFYLFIPYFISLIYWGYWNLGCYLLN